MAKTKQGTNTESERDDIHEGSARASSAEFSSESDKPKLDAASEAPKAETNSAMEEIALPKKINAKDICSRKELVYRKAFEKNSQGQEVTIVENPEPRRLYAVFGTAGNTRSGESNYGPFIEFEGHFEAVHLTTGQRSKSTRLFLQQPAQDLLLDALTQIKKEDPAGTVSFSFEVGVKVSQKWVETDQGNSYEYTIKSQINVSQHDPLAALRSQVMPLIKLAPPKPDTK